MDFDYRHPLYKKYLPRWNKYLASYLGGEDYRLPSLGMLRKYINEELAPGNQYGQRLEHTALDNLTKLAVDTYRSFLFRDSPVRTMGTTNTELIDKFMYNIDFNEMDINDFMKQCNDMAMVYGHVWVLVTKGFMEGVSTLQQEIANDVRPYAKIFTPENVVDWTYVKLPNGSERLSRLVTVESIDAETTRYTEWTPTEIVTYEVLERDNAEPKVVMTELQVNEIGEIPFIMLKANNTYIKDVGMSDIADVCSIQKALFNYFSEAEQGIRISNHPTLVKTHSTDAQAGAGSVIDLEENADPGLNPYLLEPNGTNITSITSMVELHVDAFLRQTHLGAVLAHKTQPMSGVALQTEFQQLNMRLADKAAKLEALEWNMWRLFFAYVGIQIPQDFNIEYSKSFDIRDETADIQKYTHALSLPINSDTYKKEIAKQLAKLTIEDGDMLQIVLDEIESGDAMVVSPPDVFE